MNNKENHNFHKEVAVKNSDLKQPQKRTSINKKIVSMLAIVLVLSIGIMLTFLLFTEEKLKYEKTSTYVDELSKTIIQSVTFSMSEGSTDVTPFVERIKTIENIRYFNVLATDLIRENSLEKMDSIEKKVVETKQPIFFDEEYKGEYVFRSVEPILSENSCIDCHSDSKVGDALAVVSMRYTIADTKEAIISQRIIAASMSIIAILVIFLTVRYFLRKQVLDDLLSTANTLKILSTGNLNTNLRTDRNDEMGDLIESLNTLQNSLVNKSLVASKIAEGNLDIDIPILSEDDTLGKAMNKVKENLSLLIIETEKLCEYAIEGNLSKRADNSKHNGKYAEIISGINKILDSVIGPMNVAAEYVDRISKGDIPPKITDQYNGDFNEIKNNLNGCIDSITKVVSEFDQLIFQVTRGKIDYRADFTSLIGNWASLINGINTTMNSIGNIFDSASNLMLANVDGIITYMNEPVVTLLSKYEKELKSQYPDFEVSKLIGSNIDRFHKTPTSNRDMLSRLGSIPHTAIIHIGNEIFKLIITSLNDANNERLGFVVQWNNVSDEARFQEILKSTIDEITLGRLSSRLSLDNVEGIYKKTGESVNLMLDGIVNPLRVTSSYVEKISKGDIPDLISDNYNGEFNEIKNNVNALIKALLNITQIANNISNGVLNDEINLRSENDNLMISLLAMKESINGLVEDVNTLTLAAAAGKLDVRADSIKHHGDFRKIVQGVNGTLDNVIGPLNVAAEYVDRISKGDIPPRITDSYNGDFNEIKNNLNQAIEAVNALVKDALLLVDAAERGELSTRAEVTHHQGDFRKIIEGVNKTLDLVVNPIDETSTVMSIFATGDLTSRIISEYKGDFAKLKNDTNRFAETLGELIIQLTDSIDNTASAAHQISSTAESLAAATQEQSAQADEVANAVEAMSRTITDNAMAASRTADVANKNSTMASESGRVVEQTVSKMKDIAIVVKNSATSIEQLGESSKQIGEIISVIDDIADQTNLLALNAAIEAARAGEQGRGFAVVADEVRKLAERTTEATKQIAGMIKGIQKETEQAVVAMNKGTVEVQSGIELADKAGDSLKQILTSTHEVLDMVNQIAAASEEQSATSEEISKNVIAISKVTADSTSRVEDVAKTADELARMTEQLRDLISTFKVNDGGKNFGNSRMLSSTGGKQLTSGW